MTIGAADVTFIDFGDNASEAVLTAMSSEDRELFGRGVSMVELQDQRVSLPAVGTRMSKQVVGYVLPHPPLRLSAVSGRLCNYCFRDASGNRSSSGGLWPQAPRFPRFRYIAQEFESVGGCCPAAELCPCPNEAALGSSWVAAVVCPFTRT